jgi:hypothetical protein
LSTLNTNLEHLGNLKIVTPTHWKLEHKLEHAIETRRLLHPHIGNLRTNFKDTRKLEN